MKLSMRIILTCLALLLPASHAAAQPPIVTADALTPHKAKLRTPALPCVDGSTVNFGGGATVCGVTGQLDPCNTKADTKCSTYAYMGIRYAKADRWKAPTTLAPSGAIKATAAGEVCPQLGDDGGYVGDEDCLFLNVWAPRSAINTQAKLPVMVFIHGGAFLTGAGSLPIYDGTAGALQDVVVVTLNYRLGALGFLTADKLTGDFKTINGNFGLMDQQSALNWVVANIAAFGGDPGKITLFGESAGAMSTALHAFDVPSSSKLFQSAIMESNPAGIIYQTPKESMLKGNSHLRTLCKNLSSGETSKKHCDSDRDWLRKLPAQFIVKQQLSSHSSSKANGIVDILNSIFQSLPWQPMVDGDLVTGQPFNGYSDKIAPADRKKMIGLGVNADEGTVFTAFGYVFAPKIFTISAYNALLIGKFTKQYRHIMEADRYDPDKQVVPSGAIFENQISAAVANLVTDYAFTCGNLNAANQAISSANGSKVYTYQFTQPPFFDLYNMANPSDTKTAKDGGACAPSSDSFPGYVCHANELPYVFNSVSVIAKLQQAYQPRPDDIVLSSAMATAWINFAKGVTTGWTPYTAGDTGQATVWNGKGLGQDKVLLDKVSNCSSIWFKTKPYKG